MNTNLLFVQLGFYIIQAACATIFEFYNGFLSPFFDIPDCPVARAGWRSNVITDDDTIIEGTDQLTDDLEERMPLSSAMPSAALKSLLITAATVIIHARKVLLLSFNGRMKALHTHTHTPRARLIFILFSYLTDRHGHLSIWLSTATTGLRQYSTGRNSYTKTAGLTCVHASPFFFTNNNCLVQPPGGFYSGMHQEYYGYLYEYYEYRWPMNVHFL